jgi:DNA-binding Xre family transcriptional regulator
MRWKFNELQVKYRRHTGQNITYREITAATGLSSSTISGIATNQVERVDFGTLQSLLSFFSARLGEELTTNDLLEWRPD